MPSHFIYHAIPFADTVEKESYLIASLDNTLTWQNTHNNKTPSQPSNESTKYNLFD